MLVLMLLVAVVLGLVKGERWVYGNGRRRGLLHLSS